MTAPTCPISSTQIGYYQSLFRGGNQSRPVTMPSIPPATVNDLPSLIRTVNVIRDVLRQMSSSLVVNNYYQPQPPFAKAQGDTHYIDYPAWDQKEIETAQGYVLHKDKAMPGGKDPTQKALVVRQNRIKFENRSHEDPEFIWSYSKALDITLG